MKKKTFNFKRVSVIVVIFVLIMEIFGIYQVNKYDSSVMEIYAKQQDAYVQLVLDQINIQENRTDEQIVKDILSSLDNGNIKYWTLSKEQALLFVKNVSETNRYKGFTTATFYVTDSAKGFLERLSVNHVEHSTIDIEGEKYIASGAVFEYNNTKYRICLLTNKSFILDSNSYLSTKISMNILIGGLLIAILLVSMLLLNLLDIKNKMINEYLQKTEEQNRSIEELEIKVKGLNNYHTRWNMFNFRMMDTFINKLEIRNVRPVVLMQIKFETEESHKEFLSTAQLMLDKKVIRFSYGKDRIRIIFVKYTERQAKDAIKAISDKNMTIEKIMICENENMELVQVYNEFKEHEDEQ